MIDYLAKGTVHKPVMKKKPAQRAGFARREQDQRNYGST
jgi:hypothetical protein